MTIDNNYYLRVSILDVKNSELYSRSFSSISELWYIFRASPFCPKYMHDSVVQVDNLKKLPLYKYVSKNDPEYEDYNLAVNKTAVYCFGFLDTIGGITCTVLCQVWEPNVEYL